MLVPAAGENFKNLQFFIEFETLFQQKIEVTRPPVSERIIKFILWSFIKDGECPPSESKEGAFFSREGNASPPPLGGL